MALIPCIYIGSRTGFAALCAARTARRAVRATGFAAWAARAPTAWWIRVKGLSTVSWCAQSHASYGRCGLGSEGTDRLVALVRAEAAAARAAGAQPPLYGAKITGGGSGGAQALTL